MKFRYNLIALLLTLNGIHIAYADELAIGVEVEVETSVYKGIKRDFTILPIINYDNDVIFIDGMEAGIYLHKSDKQKLSILSEYYDVGFTPKDSSDGQMKKLNKRHKTIMSGLDYLYIGKWGGINVNVSTDILNKNKGTVADVAYVAMYEKNYFTVVPKIGVKWQNNRYNNYYYGVSKKEAQKSSFSPYRAKQGVNPYIEVGMNYQLSPQWDIFLLERYEQLNREIKNSPIVRKKSTSLTQMGIKYSF